MKAKLLIIAIIALFLAGCGPMYDTYYTYQAPQSIQGRQCIITCQQARTVCRSAKMTEENMCQSRAEQDARFQYAEYRSHQRAIGKPVTKDLNYFYNGFGCGGGMTDFPGCTANFNDCYTMCGGRVLVHKRCVAFCGKN